MLEPFPEFPSLFCLWSCACGGGGDGGDGCGGRGDSCLQLPSHLENCVIEERKERKYLFTLKKQKTNKLNACICKLEFVHHLTYIEHIPN